MFIRRMSEIKRLSEDRVRSGLLLGARVVGVVHTPPSFKLEELVRIFRSSANFQNFVKISTEWARLRG